MAQFERNLCGASGGDDFLLGIVPLAASAATRAIDVIMKAPLAARRHANMFFCKERGTVYGFAIGRSIRLSGWHPARDDGEHALTQHNPAKRRKQ